MYHVSRRFSLFLSLTLALLGCSGSNGVTVHYEYSFGYALGGRPTARGATAPIWDAYTLVAQDGTRIEGVFADGEYRFADAPSGPYSLIAQAKPSALFPSDRPFIYKWDGLRRRTFEFGSRNWYRDDVEYSEQEPLPFVLDATGLVAWDDDGDIQLVSGSADMQRTVLYGALTTPDEGETSGRFEVEADAMLSDDGHPGVPLLRPEDDLTALQMVSVDFDIEYDATPYSPYYAVPVEYVAATARVEGRYREDETATLTAAFTPAATTPHTFDLRPSSFASLREELGFPDAAQSRLTVTVVREPGTDEDYFIGITPIAWTFQTKYVSGAPIEPECFPDAEGVCDATCAGVCNAMRAGFLDPEDRVLNVDLPETVTTPGTELFLLEYTFRLRFMHPDEGTVHYLSANAKMQMRLSDVIGPVQRTLGAPRNVQIDGMSMPWSAAPNIAVLESTTPLVTFDAPTMGAVTDYEIEVVELEPATSASGGARTSRIVSTILTTETSARIPANVLIPGRHYYVRVIATSNGRVFGRSVIIPRATPEHETVTPTYVFRVLGP